MEKKVGGVFHNCTRGRPAFTGGRVSGLVFLHVDMFSYSILLNFQFILYLSEKLVKKLHIHFPSELKTRCTLSNGRLGKKSFSEDFRYIHYNNKVSFTWQITSNHLNNIFILFIFESRFYIYLKAPI